MSCACSRRGLLGGLALGAAPGLAGAAVTVARSPRIAGIDLPDTAAARAAMELGRTAMPGYLFNHCMRTFLFGTLVAHREKIAHDAEALLIASALHDIGLTPAHSKPGQPFEMDSADAAKTLTLKQGRGEREAELVWRMIAYHTSALGAHEAEQVGLVGAGAGADVFGSGLKTFKAEEVAAIVGAYPRLGFKKGFADSLTAYCKRKPYAQVGTWTDAYCRAHAPEVKWPDLEAGMNRAPFAD